jgi:hypothetical protein
MVSVKVKSSTPLELRIDIQDSKGNTSNTIPVSKTITPDGSYAVYSFDFTGKYSQTNPTASIVDSSKIDKIIFYTNSGSTYNGSFIIDDITIGKTPIRTTKLTISPTLEIIRVGEISRFNCTIEPIDATNKLLTWSVEDTTIAKISPEGIITPLNTGTSKIIVQSIDNPSVSSYSFIKVSGEIFDNTELKTKILLAQKTLDSAIIGTEVRQYPKANYDALQTELTNATIVLNDKNTNQYALDQSAYVLDFKIITFIKSEIGFTLQLSITNASKTLDTTKFDNKAEYDSLKNMIENAKTVLHKTGVSVSELNKTSTELDAFVSKLTKRYTSVYQIEKQDIIVSPSPFKSILEIKSPENAINSVQLIGLNGKVLINIQNNSNSCIINTEGLTLGTYILIISLQSGFTKTITVSKVD